jgi:hypothetical protein
MVDLTRDELFGMSLRESFGASYNAGMDKTVWRKQIDHSYCDKCRAEYKMNQEEEMRKSNERSDILFYRRFLPGLLIAFATYLFVLGYLT